MKIVLNMVIKSHLVVIGAFDMNNQRYVKAKLVTCQI